MGSRALGSVLQPYWRTAQLDWFWADLLPGTSQVAARRGCSPLPWRCKAKLCYYLNYFGLVSLSLIILLLAWLILPYLHRQAVTERQQPL